MTIIEDGATETLANQHGGELRPIDLSNEPELRALVEAANPDGLSGGQNPSHRN
jgi:hypothetical protein